MCCPIIAFNLFFDFISGDCCRWLVMDNIANILGLCRGISWMAPEAKHYRAKCRGLAGRVQDLEKLVEAISSKGQVSQDVDRALRKLFVALTAGHELVKKCAKNLLLNPLKCVFEFNSVNDDLRDTYHVLSTGALHVKQGNRNHRKTPQYVSDDERDDHRPVLYDSRPQNRYSAAAAPQQSAMVYAAEIGIEDDAAYFAETFFIVQ